MLLRSGTVMESRPALPRQEEEMDEDHYSTGTTGAQCGSTPSMSFPDNSQSPSIQEPSIRTSRSVTPRRGSGQDSHNQDPNTAFGHMGHDEQPLTYPTTPRLHYADGLLQPGTVDPYDTVPRISLTPPPPSRPQDFQPPDPPGYYTHQGRNVNDAHPYGGTSRLIHPQRPLRPLLVTHNTEYPPNPSETLQRLMGPANNEPWSPELGPGQQTRPVHVPSIPGLDDRTSWLPEGAGKMGSDLELLEREERMGGGRESVDRREGSRGGKGRGRKGKRKRSKRSSTAEQEEKEVKKKREDGDHDRDRGNGNGSGYGDGNGYGYGDGYGMGNGHTDAGRGYAY